MVYVGLSQCGSRVLDNNRDLWHRGRRYQTLIRMILVMRIHSLMALGYTWDLLSKRKI